MKSITGLPRTKSLRAVLAGILALAMVTAAIGGFLLTRDSAQAANASVAVGAPNNRFAPNVVNVNVGNTVTFSWAAGTHIVDLKDVSPDIPIDSAHTGGTTNAFITAGTYYYYCSIHATADLATEAHVAANDAMVGKIVVTPAAAGGTTPAAGATTAPTAPGTGNSAYGDSDVPASLLIAGALVAALVGLGGYAISRR